MLMQLCAVFYFASLGLLALYGLHRLWLLLCWSRGRHSPDPLPPPPDEREESPIVTVQLPIFNERFVVARLLDAAAALDWPADRLEIQVLDDSDDDTRAIVDERVAYWRAKGIDMLLVRRKHRRGYKAGALALGLGRAKGELIAVFDADFIPASDFLRQTVPHFRSPEVGMVQARWGFCNTDHSWLTRLQALLLEPHFRIEHRVRCRRGLFFNFNGTAGLWRRGAIESAGGWQSDTVTEDLDLSYRAQLAGWRFIYLDEVVVDSELPATVSAFRSQQQRWAKGSIQTARKLLPRLLTAPLPRSVKAEAAIHLLSNLGWLFGTIVTLTLYPVITWRIGVGPYQLLRYDLPLFFGASGALALFFLIHLLAHRNFSGLLYFPLLPALTVGLAPTLAGSVIAGAVKRGGIFERTPKYGIRGRQRSPGLMHHYRRPVWLYLAIELFLFGYTLLPLIFAWQREVWPALPLAALFPAGFLLLVFRDAREL
ncbi:glycosyltransferase [Desulfuromonas sp. TF]|uniref:glycosyltransferase n=1 Tax=Desulfuromonas sp. TF TaxID=1232410 RepID=UPI0004060F3A|nr:glycosyltransferase [Desulfuromonas sp. TF]